VFQFVISSPTGSVLYQTTLWEWSSLSANVDAKGNLYVDGLQVSNPDVPVFELRVGVTAARDPQTLQQEVVADINVALEYSRFFGARRTSLITAIRDYFASANPAEMERLQGLVKA
jgi:hypothetical protein